LSRCEDGSILKREMKAEKDGSPNDPDAEGLEPKEEMIDGWEPAAQPFAHKRWRPALLQILLDIHLISPVLHAT
jgi:hypothetical protein